MVTRSLAKIPKRKEIKTPRKKQSLLLSKNKKMKTAPRERAKAVKSKKNVATIRDAEIVHTAHGHSHAQKIATISHSTLPHKKSEPLGHLLVEKLLREGGFHGGVSSNKDILDRYANDESIFTIRPQVVIQPKSIRDVEIAVSIVARETTRFTSLSLTPRAAGTGLGGGALTDSLVIDVSTHLNHIGEIHVTKAGTTITCEPGAMWRDVEKKLKRHGVYLPSYPASKDICTLGGAVANNAAGPDSYRYGHTANWVESLDVVLYDGKRYTIKPLSYSEYTKLSAKANAHGKILKEVFTLLEQNEKSIVAAKPKTTKNSAGYALWDLLSVPVDSFKKGHGTLDLTRLFCGSQGTIGIITSITMRTEPIAKYTELVVVPIFDLVDAGKAIMKARDFDPVNIELFDGLTFDLALKNPSFFKDRLGTIDYYKVLVSMYTTYHVRYGRKTPDFTLLITLDKTRGNSAEHLAQLLRKTGAPKARVAMNPIDREMFWQIRRASYSLSKLEDPKKRPAAFLEDMIVPPKNIPRFFSDIKRLLKKYNLTAAIHGHGGDGHLHFYPLIDFTQKTTPQLIMKMSEEFFAAAIKHDGGLCGEHNDGILVTPHLAKMFSKETIELFEAIEHSCDPDNIFNPGKKVHPRFNIKSSIRHTNQNATIRDGELVSAPL